MYKPEPLWSQVTQTFFKGCLIVLPLLLSVYFLVWMLNSFDGLFNRLLPPHILGGQELPFGIGIFLGIVLIFLAGLSVRLPFFRFLESWIEGVFHKIPIVGTVFSSLSDIMRYLKPMRGTNTHGKSVIVTLANSDFKIAGFLTRDGLDDLPTSDNLKDHVAVYIPLAYMVGGGFTIFVRRDQVHALDLSFEKAMQLSLTAWMAHNDAPGPTPAK